jgi:hypothetical protein
VKFFGSPFSPIQTDIPTLQTDPDIKIGCHVYSLSEIVHYTFIIYITCILW